MRKLLIPSIVLIIAALLMSMFVIPEGERGIVIRFGRVLKDNNDLARIYEPGLHFKMPLFDRVKTLDARIQTMDGRSDRFVTSEKKDVIMILTLSGVSKILANTTWQPVVVMR